MITAWKITYGTISGGTVGQAHQHHTFEVTALTREDAETLFLMGIESEAYNYITLDEVTDLLDDMPALIVPVKSWNRSDAAAASRGEF